MQQLSKISKNTSSSKVLEKKIIRRFGEYSENISVYISVVSAQFKSADSIFLHKKLFGLFLKDGSLVMITIKGLSKKMLEF